MAEDNEKKIRWQEELETISLLEDVEVRYLYFLQKEITSLYELILRRLRNKYKGGD